LTWSGRRAAAESSVNSSALTSTWPVGSLGLTVSAVRSTTGPVTVTTLSTRSASKAGNSGLETSTTHWVSP
jgi:hypothetical protein